MQAGTPVTDLPRLLCVRTGYVSLRLRTVIKGLVFLFVCVLETQSLDFNRGHTCGKELVLRRIFSLLPPTSACSFLGTKQSTGAEEDLRAEDQEGRCVTKRVPLPRIDCPAVGRASRCSSSHNVPYAGHRHPHRAEEDVPCSHSPWLTELHRRESGSTDLLRERKVQRDPRGFEASCLGTVTDIKLNLLS